VNQEKMKKEWIWKRIAEFLLSWFNPRLGLIQAAEQDKLYTQPKLENWRI
jgi:hypothetical protein